MSRFEQTGGSQPLRFPALFLAAFVLRIAAKMERSLTVDMPRDEYVKRCKERAFDYLDRGELRKAAALFVRDMNARPDCELPDHLMALSASLLMVDDVLGWRAWIDGLR